MFRKLKYQTKWWGAGNDKASVPYCSLWYLPLPFHSGLLPSSLSGHSAQDLVKYVSSVFTFALSLRLSLFPPSRPSSENHVLHKGFPAIFYWTWCLSSPRRPSTWLWHLGSDFSALFLSSPASSTLCSAYCLHSHPVLLIINFLRAGVCLINFYIISSTWHRPRPLWALKLNRILAMNCSSRPDFVSENCSGFRGQFSDIPSLENSIFHCYQ